MDGSRDAAVIAGPRVGEHLTSHHGEPERALEFAIREQTGIGRDDGSTKLTIYPWSTSPSGQFERTAAKLPDDVKLSVHWRTFEMNPNMPPEGLRQAGALYVVLLFGF